MTTKIDFYILPEQTQPESIRFVSRLAEKAYLQGHQIFINAESPEQTQQLNDSLWTFRDISFVPHNIYEENSTNSSPIQIGYSKNPSEHNGILINLAEAIPPFFSRFDRVLEIVLHEKKTDGRNRYKQYEQQKCNLTTHNI